MIDDTREIERLLRDQLKAIGRIEAKLPEVSPNATWEYDPKKYDLVEKDKYDFYPKDGYEHYFKGTVKWIAVMAFMAGVFAANMYFLLYQLPSLRQESEERHQESEKRHEVRYQELNKRYNELHDKHYDLKP
jgi:hypothetical protein